MCLLYMHVEIEPCVCLVVAFWSLVIQRCIRSACILCFSFLYTRFLSILLLGMDRLFEYGCSVLSLGYWDVRIHGYTQGKG